MANPGDWEDEADAVVVGSGAGGATVSVALSEQGWETAVIEEGGWHTRAGFTEDLHGAMGTLFRDFGAQAAWGRSLIPVLEGRCVGGSTVLNGAIVHRLPPEVHAAWCEDRALGAALPYASLERHAGRIEQELSVRANLEEALPALPVSGILDRSGWRYRAMARNAPGCRGSGRCLQGCPTGGKLSMEASFLPRALRAGARILDRRRAERVLFEGTRAVGVLLRDAEGRARRVRARRAVVVCAGAVQTPLLLSRSGLKSPHLGRHFQCHLGVGVAGLLDRPAASVLGPPQGIEILQTPGERFRLATQLLPLELLLARAGVVGTRLSELLRRAGQVSSWTASVRSGAEGRVVPGFFGRASIRYTPAPADLEAIREGVHALARLLFDLGASRVFPGVAGMPDELTAASQAGALRSAPLDPRAYSIVVGHIFGTCRMAGEPARGVVGPDFRVHGTERLYVADASVFPTNLGVNPQHAIMTLARHAAEGLMERGAE